LKKDYGLRRKKEILRAESILRNYRKLARELAASRDETREAILMAKLRKIGLVDDQASLDEILALTIENILDRRLQTIIFKKGLARTPVQARQFIVHGHIAIDGQKTRWPSTLIPIEKENSITYYHRSNVKETVLKKLAPKKEVKEKPKEEAKPEVKEEPKPKEKPKVEVKKEGEENGGKK